MKKVQKLSLQWLKRVTFKHNHSAFTDLIEFKTNLWLCFREATNHISGDGKIVVLQLRADGSVISRYALNLPGADLRDPKLSVTPMGELLLLAYARFTDNDNRTLRTDNVAWTSQSGLSWSSPISLGPNTWWLWRIRWDTQNNQAFGLAYNRRANRIDLYAGNPKRHMQRVYPGVLSLSKHGLGYPNESDLHIADDGQLHALVRRDADSFHAMLGTARAPYTHWHWRDLGCYIGGPVWFALDKKNFIVAGRTWNGKTMITRLWQLNIDTARLLPLLDLPSGGDNSYPGLVVRGHTLYVSYYSSHHDNCSEIYLAALTLE
ncbi:hypothetical protein [Alteromonas flava]|uniref:hypothetical protein n=1 Tax=Alteromonas flava TaxID=2048003 RepID=UPI000C28B417|nr:hypothetical protein [Alteromonas flava]